ncbi:MAG: aldo/keto reductase [Candidatus Lokiarchaeota archaeon]|nr:aldo/keto reductase [Candidatus Lokiarchaeota archaeon]
MKYRKLGKTGFDVSEVSLGTWQLGGVWGEIFDENIAKTTLQSAISNDINLFDTADVYRDGLSEHACGSFRNEQKNEHEIYIATKCGRKLNPHETNGYNRKNLERFVNESLKNLNADHIDLLQLHCPPTDVYYKPEVFSYLDDFVNEGKVKNYGVSVERVEEGLKALEYENLSTIQIIFNAFRQRPKEILFEEAKKKNVGIIARVPLASGLLSGKFTEETQFGKEDHRFFNRNGEVFDKGETFSGVDYRLGLEVAEKIKLVFDNPQNLAPYALRWILMFDAVSCVIPGASKPDHILSNASSSFLPPLSKSQMQEIEEIYDSKIKPVVHNRW